MLTSHGRHPDGAQRVSPLAIELGQPAAIRREAFGRIAKLAIPFAYAVLLAVSYYLSARLGLSFRFQLSQIGVVWPANAVFLSALLLTPRSRWWIVFVATALAHTAAVGPLLPVWRLVWQIAGTSAFAMGTAEILRRFAGLPLHFGSRRQVFAYTVISFAMPALFGFTTPAFILSSFGLESATSPAVALLRTTFSNSTALLLVAPVVLLWADYGLPRLRELRKSHLFEASAILISLLGVSLLALGTGPEIARLPWLLLWVFPPLVWAAVRFGPLGASTSLFIVAALSMWGAARQLGPFVLRTNADLVLSLQLFWMALWLPVTLLAAVIRERQLTEEALQNQRNQLAHVIRVATAGELSAALAHEVRQPLASILLNAQVGAELLAPPAPRLDEARVVLNDIADQSRKAGQIVASMRSFLRKEGSHLESLSVETVVRDALALAHSAIAMSDVHVQTEIAAHLPLVRGDPVQLLQVVLNLIVNACEAMSTIPAPDRRLRLRVARTSDEQVEVRVADRGPGLPAGAEERVFEPFFTTKKKGLGLGLAIGRSIVAAHGGRLWGENNPKGGATFHLVLRAIMSARKRNQP